MWGCLYFVDISVKHLSIREIGVFLNGWACTHILYIRAMTILGAKCMMRVLMGFSLWIIASSVWSQSDTVYSYHDHRLIGMRMAIGSASAPSGWWGFSLFGGQKHIEYHLSLARTNVQRYSFGMDLRGDAQQKWTWHASFNFVHARPKQFTFDPDASSRREYRVSDSQFVHAGVGIMRRIRGYQKRDCRNFVFTVGYQWRISDFSIDPVDGSNFKQSEIDRFTNDLFKSRWFWSVAFRFGEFWPKKK